MSPVPGMRPASSSPLPLIFASANLSRVYFPFRAIPGSILIHLLILFAIAHFPAVQGPRDKDPFHRRKALALLPEEIDQVMYLPLLDAARPKPQPGKEASGPESTAPPSQQARGLVYPGPQKMLSKPDNPNNLTQTLLQPDLVPLPLLRPPLALPNFVQIARVRVVAPPRPESAPSNQQPTPAESPEVEQAKAEPEAKADVNPIPDKGEPAEAVEAGIPLKVNPLPPRLEEPPAERVVKLEPLPLTDLLERQEDPVQLPAMALASLFPHPNLPPEAVRATRPDAPKKPPEAAPVSQPSSPPTEPESEAAEPEPKPQDQTSTPEPGPDGTHENPGQGIASIQPTATSPESPPGPEPTARPEAGPDARNILSLTVMPVTPTGPIEIPVGEARGSFAVSPEPNLTASGSEPGDPNSPKPAEDAEVTTTGPSSTGGTGGAGNVVTPTAPGPSTLSGSGTDSANNGVSLARGGGQGLGEGSGNKGETTSGTDTGTLSQAVRKPFSGIRIIGGPDDTEKTSKPSARVQVRRPLQTHYGLRIISTEKSGGGLPSYGVFSDEQVYTVYLDMRQTETDVVPNWTLEFGVARDTFVPPSSPQSPQPGSQGLALPFPVEKKAPELPFDLVARYRGGRIIVFAVVNGEGKLEALEVKESPSPELNDAVLEALRKWVFRPAVLDGNPTSVKVLMGIPIGVDR